MSQPGTVTFCDRSFPFLRFIETPCGRRLGSQSLRMPSDQLQLRFHLFGRGFFEGLESLFDGIHECED